jgi:enterochelin esterase-like enzyme
MWGAIGLVIVAVGGFVAYKVVVPSIHPERYGVRITDFSLIRGDEQYRGKVVHPPGDRDIPRPVVVLLHGRGSSPEGMLSDEMFAALRDSGDRAPIVVLPESPTEASYWHDRADGAFGRFVTEDVIPLAIGEVGADPKRVAIGGISMGGFGALDLARQDPNAYCAVGAHSPALWRSASETAEGAFDDAEDFEVHDVMQAAQDDPRMYGDTPVRIDVGDEDPFAGADEAFAGSLQGDVSFEMAPGDHNESYWNAHMDDYIDFYATSCAFHTHRRP